MAKQVRVLNKYEAMLATSTVVVGVDLDGTIDEEQLHCAWSRVTTCYEVTRTKLVHVDSHIHAQVAEQGTTLRRDELDPEHTLEESAVICGNALPVDGAIVAARIAVLPDEAIRIILTFNHALSDGPGAWAVLATLLEQLADDAKTPSPQPIVDVQHELLKTQVESDALFGEACVSEETRPSWLPVEMQQDIPKDHSDAVLGTIDSVHRTIPIATVHSLRDVCRGANASVQGALTAASVVARIALLKSDLPIKVPVLVPVNARGVNVSPRSCACGSAGIWVLLDVDERMTVRELAASLTENLRAGLKRNSHVEWTRRIMEQPSTLIPHALMASSIGLVPVAKAYGEVNVRNTAFFAARQPSEMTRDAVATMIHWATTEGESKFAFNYTVPGVAKHFAIRNADAVVRVLNEMVQNDISVTETMHKLTNDLT